MIFFRDITSGQSLEDVDISVHCDVTIFEWLMDWLKAQAKDKSAPEAIDIVQAEGKDFTIIRDLVTILKLRVGISKNGQIPE